MTERLTTYTAFWPYYLRKHAGPATRGLHYVETGLPMVLFRWTLVKGAPLMLLVVLFAGYGFAWTAHAFVERNRPATFTYPIWSLVNDFCMFGLWAIRWLKPHLERAGVR
jgi:hypothetical protein